MISLWRKGELKISFAMSDIKINADKQICYVRSKIKSIFKTHIHHHHSGTELVLIIKSIQTIV